MMKKFCLLIFLSGIFSITGAQVVTDDALFALRLRLGYNFPVATGILATNFNNGTTEGIYGSWGKGFVPAIDFSVRTYQNAWTVIGANMLFGPDVKSSNIYSTEGSLFDQTTSSRLMIPAIITFGGRYHIHWWDGQNGDDDSYCHHFIPYAGFGAGIALGAEVKNSVISVQTIGTSTTTNDIRSTTTFKPALDLYGELGVKYMISQHISVFIDARLTSMSLMPVKQVINLESVNGVDVTSGLTPYEKETDFVKNVPPQASNQNEPRQQLAEKLPASGIAVNCGLVWDIGLGGKVLFGGPGRGVPPGGVKNKEKAKNAGAIEAVACDSCPPPVLIIVSNNDGKNFPKENIIYTKNRPFGKSTLLSIDTVKVDAGCDSCPGDKNTCCCRLRLLKLTMDFQITIDTADLNKGVWMNTNQKSGEFGHTKTGKALPESLKNKEDWKKVDQKSVEVHERRHCADMKDSATAVIERTLKQYLPRGTCNCKVKTEDKRCKEDMRKQCAILKKKMNTLIFDEMEQIAANEEKANKKGEMEQNARKTQADELNNRPK